MYNSICRQALIKAGVEEIMFEVPLASPKPKERPEKRFMYIRIANIAFGALWHSFVTDGDKVYDSPNYGTSFNGVRIVREYSFNVACEIEVTLGDYHTIILQSDVDKSDVEVQYAYVRCKVSRASFDGALTDAQALINLMTEFTRFGLEVETSFKGYPVLVKVKRTDGVSPTGVVHV